MPLSCWIKRLLRTVDRQRKKRVARARGSDDIELSVMRLEDRRVLNAAGPVDVAAVAAGSPAAAPAIESQPPAAAESVASQAAPTEDIAPSAAGAADMVIAIDRGSMLRLYQKDGWIVLQSDVPSIVVDGETVTKWAQPIEDLTNLTIIGSNDDDTLIVDFNGGDMLPVTFDGRGGDDSLGIIGQRSAVEVIYDGVADIDSGVVIVDGKTVDYDSVEDNSVNISGVTDLTLQFTGGDPAVTFTAVDNDTTQLAGDSFSTTTFDNPSYSLSIIFDDAAYVVSVTDLADDFDPSEGISVKGAPWTGNQTLVISDLGDTFGHRTNGVFDIDLGGGGRDLVAFQGTTPSLTSLSVDADVVQIGVPSIVTSGDQIYWAEVRLGTDVTLDAANVTFTDTVSGRGNDLTVNSPNTTFGSERDDAVSGIGTLITDAAGTTTINAATIDGRVLQFHDAVIVTAANTNLTGAAGVAFRAPVNGVTTGRQNLTIQSAGTISIDGVIGDRAGLSSLVLDAGTTVVQTEEILASLLILLGTADFRLLEAANDFDVVAARTAGTIEIVDVDDLTIGETAGVYGITNVGGGDVAVTAAGVLSVERSVGNTGGGDTVLSANGGDLQVNARVASLGGDGDVQLNAAGNLVIRNTADALDIQGDGGRIVGQAGGEVHIAVGTRIQTSTGFLQLTGTPGGTIDPVVRLVPVDQGGSNVDSRGNAVIEVTVQAPAGQNFEILVDWSDGTVDRYLLPQTTPFDGSQVHEFRHVYTAPPDPLNPAAPIPVSVTAAFDGRLPHVGGAADNGIVFYRLGGTFIETTVADTLTVPGEGVFGFIIIVESEIEVIELGRRQSEVLVSNAGVVVGEQATGLELQEADLESQASSAARLFLRRVDSSGKESEDIELEIGLLEEGLVPALSRLPNGRYRVYYQEENSERIRMVREVYVYQGRVVPLDFRSDTSERQPSDVPSADPDEQSDAEMPAEPAATEAAGSRTAADDAAAAQPSSDSSAVGASQAAFAVGATAVVSRGGSGRLRWAERVDRFYASGGLSRAKARRRRGPRRRP